MGEAGVFTSGCILGLRQYVSGCLGLYQPGSRHQVQDWVGMLSDAHRVGQPLAATETGFQTVCCRQREEGKKV